jgi:hypothetical protein
MKSWIVLLTWLGAALPLGAWEMETEWAYHSAGNLHRLSESVPGNDLRFLANGTDEVSTSDTVTLHVLTAHQFAKDLEEQIFVRWWDGAMAHWVMGTWVKTLHLDAGEMRFRGQPEDGTAAVDMWRVDIPPWITQTGDNFYAIQLKGLHPDGTAEERYLLCTAGGDFTRTNRLGQIWSASEEFDGQDWRIQIVP